MFKTSFKPGQTINLGKIDTNADSGMDKKESIEIIAKNSTAISNLTYRLYGECKRSVLIVLQAMDTAGKDGTIRHVVDSVNPQSCQVYSFKAPNSEELAHDFLWRIHQCTPRRGNITVFNRSHYEDVLVARVHDLVPKEVWQGRYEQINAFEKLLTDSGTVILKFFLHISKDEQKARLQERLDDPDKRWKFSVGDIAERKLWPKYMEAYQDAIEKCNTEYAPWHIIPADRKWHRNLLVGNILRKTLEEMNPQFPKALPGIEKSKVE